MTDEQLAEIRLRCDAATEGPWEVAWKTDFIWQLDGDGDRFEPIAEAHYAEGNHHNNATFIAHARADIPALLAEVERLREECHDAKAERAHYGDIVTSRLGALENENERLKANLERCEQQCDALSEDSFYVADTMKKNDELLAEIERLREELATRQWASVVDRMPPNKAPVIMATFWGGVFDGLWDADAGEWYMGTTRMPSITHWMPLPEPPEEAARD